MQTDLSKRCCEGSVPLHEQTSISEQLWKCFNIKSGKCTFYMATCLYPNLFISSATLPFIDVHVSFFATNKLTSFPPSCIPIDYYTPNVFVVSRLATNLVRFFILIICFTAILSFSNLIRRDSNNRLQLRMSHLIYQI